MKHNLTSLIAVVLALAFSASACGPRVKRISLHDNSIPVDSRRFVADTEDAVAIARVKRDEAQRELSKVRDWRREVVRGTNWPSAANAAIDQLEVLADNRVELAQMELERADAALELAKAKYDLVTAETAIRHDVAAYDLGPLRQRTDEAREALHSLSEGIINKRDEIDDLTTKWWSAYSKWARKGDTRLYYVPFIDVEASKAPAKKRKVAKKDDEKKKEKKDTEKEDPTKKPAKEAEEKKPESKGDELRIW